MFFDIIQNIINTKKNINRERREKKSVIRKLKNVLNSS